MAAERAMTQLDRIEAKLDWLRWRVRWGEQASVIYDERGGAVGTRPADIGPEPPWPSYGTPAEEEK